MYNIFSYFHKDVIYTDRHHATFIILAATQQVAYKIFGRHINIASKNPLDYTIRGRISSEHPFMGFTSPSLLPLDILFNRTKNGNNLMQTTVPTMVKAITSFKYSFEMPVISDEIYMMINNKYIMVFGRLTDHEKKFPVKSINAFLIKRKRQ